MSNEEFDFYDKIEKSQDRPEKIKFRIEQLEKDNMKILKENYELTKRLDVLEDKVRRHLRGDLDENKI